MGPDPWVIGTPLRGLEPTAPALPGACTAAERAARASPFRRATRTSASLMNRAAPCAERGCARARRERPGMRSGKRGGERASRGRSVSLHIVSARAHWQGSCLNNSGTDIAATIAGLHDNREARRALRARAGEPKSSRCVVGAGRCDARIVGRGAARVLASAAAFRCNRCTASLSQGSGLTARRMLRTGRNRTSERDWRLSNNNKNQGSGDELS